MKTAEAISRLVYTIGKENKPNKNDKEALNQLIKDLNKHSEENTKEHYLLAKLYAVMLCDFNDVLESNKQINKLLSEPLEYHLDKLLLILKSQNLSNYLGSKEIYDPLLNKENYETYKHLFPSISAEGMQYAQDAWNMDKLVAHFKFSLNQSIINFKNNV